MLSVYKSFHETVKYASKEIVYLLQDLTGFKI